MTAKIVRRFILTVLVTIIPLSASHAQKPVDPDKVAPEYREAAVKRRAEQFKIQECSRRVDAGKVLPRDRTAQIQQCLDEP